MRVLYNQIKHELDKLNFKELWPNFKRYEFALYNDKEVYLENEVIPHDDRFLGNTAIPYNDSQLAIWKVDDPKSYNPIKLTSKMVHEMFHAYQYENKDIRFPNEIKALDYNYSSENISLKIEETKSLINAYQNNDIEELNQFASIRKHRQNKFPFELSYETKIETIEGMANYVELETLKQLNTDYYLEEINNIITKLKTPSNYIPIRSISYLCGALLLTTAHNLDIKIHHDISNENKPVYNLLNLEENKEISVKSYEVKELDEYKQNIKSKITSVLNSDYIEYQVDDFKGFDPLNTFKIDNYIHFKYFAYIISNNEDKFVMGESVGVLEEDKLIKLINKK